jgi:type II secretion system protein L
VEVAQPGTHVCFAVPAADVTLFALEISVEERKHIGKSLPFMLEERLATDIDDLHFAWNIEGKTRLTAAVCSRTKMLKWQAALAECAAVNHWVPEPLLLPWQEGEWTLLIEENTAIVRTGAFAGYGIEVELLPAMLQATLDETAQPPLAVVVYGQHQQDDSAMIPAAIADRIQWRRGDLRQALLLAQLPAQSFNLLQSEFAVHLPLARWWKQWRAVAAIVALAFCVNLIATYAEFSSLARENESLRLAVEQSYRKAYPRGALVDAEKQLKRQLAALRGSGQTSGFVSLINRVGEVITRYPGTQIASINYNDTGDEVRMNITASDFEAVEDIRAAMNKAGMSAKMESSNVQGERVRARMRIGAGS